MALTFLRSNAIGYISYIDGPIDVKRSGASAGY